MGRRDELENVNDSFRWQHLSTDERAKLAAKLVPMLAEKFTAFLP
jgi:hypothetical protein